MPIAQGYPFHCHACRAVSWKMTNRSAESDIIASSFFLCFFCPFAWAREKISIKMHSIKSISVTGPSKILCSGVYVCTFHPENFTGCGSEGVKMPKECFCHRECFFSSAEPSGTQTCIISSHTHSGLQNVWVAIFKSIGVESSEITINFLLYFPVDCLLERSLNLSSATSPCWGIVNGRTAREEVMIIGWNLWKNVCPSLARWSAKAWST